jgi:hypothetical protein
MLTTPPRLATKVFDHESSLVLGPRGVARAVVAYRLWRLSILDYQMGRGDLIPNHMGKAGMHLDASGRYRSPQSEAQRTVFDRRVDVKSDSVPCEAWDEAELRLGHDLLPLFPGRVSFSRIRSIKPYSWACSAVKKRSRSTSRAMVSTDCPVFSA